MTIKAAAIIPAGGVGLRMGLDHPKQFLELGGMPILIRTLQVFHLLPSITTIVVAAPVGHQEQLSAMLERYGLFDCCQVVAGGRLRQDSVLAALKELPAGIELVAVHDAVRPLVSGPLVEDCLREAERSGAAIAAIPVKDTLKEVGDRLIAGTVSRDGLWQAQTPQVVRVDLLRRAYEQAARDGFIGTDEASLLEHAGIPVTVVAGSERNIKITRPEDLPVAEALLGAASMEERKNVPDGYGGPRIGHGYDVHRLVSGRPLVLGGVAIPHDFGLLGHSDADVLCHALCDALLGAAGLGDIGNHFPDTDPRYKGIASLRLVEQVVALLRENGWQLVNADVTVVAQAPKLSPHFPAMRDNLARSCRVAPERINVKATTTEELGFAGRREGMAAHAVALLQPLA